MKILNVGGGSRNLPPQYANYEQTLLDIDQSVKPDLCFDAKDLRGRGNLRAQFDVVFNSHCLEHFYAHDVPLVLEGFAYVLNDEGFADINVPNIRALFQDLAARNYDVSDVWYRTGENQPITFHDVLYGWDAAMSNGNLYYAHRCGFTATSLSHALVRAGFKSVWVSEQHTNLHAVAYKKEGVPCPQP